jgi:phosphoribosylanthranilate isomerase
MTKIKICGIKTLPDALAAIEAGADLLGFNFYPKSPRYITPEACAEITSVLREKYPAVTLVGVFVNSPADEIRATLQTAHLHLAQLHGDETPEMLTELGPLAFKAIRLPSSVSLRESVKESASTPSASLRDSVTKSASTPSVSLRESVKESVFSQSASIRDSATESASTPSASLRESVKESVFDPSVSLRESVNESVFSQSVTSPALLVDAAAPNLYGGSGITTDWDAAAQIAQQYPILLAGGLTPENVAEAIRTVQPWGVDVASGVESAPGIKDPGKMQAFVKAVRGSQ